MTLGNYFILQFNFSLKLLKNELDIIKKLICNNNNFVPICIY